MGYCAKVKFFSHVICVIAFLLISYRLNDVHCIANVPGKSWPNMKTYDIWGSETNKNQESTLHSQRSPFSTSNDLLIHDYSEKTSFRNEKGIMDLMPKTRIYVLIYCVLALILFEFINPCLAINL